MAKKSALFTCSLCLSMLVLITPVRLASPHLAGGKDLSRSSSSASFLGGSCAETTLKQPAAGVTAFAGAAAAPQGCADPIDKCKKPIKYLGSKGACACFACEYGKARQHNVCTQNVNDKQTLFAESTP